MLLKSLMRTIISDQLIEIKHQDHIISRDVYSMALTYEGNSALVIKGVRRVGKSTLLKQIINTRFPASFFYFNFDDERVYGFGVEDFQVLIETFIELFGESKNVFFDEIQNVRGWELFINRLLREGYKVFITGSNSNLLSQELGTHLTGRHTDLELYPFSFAEYIRSRELRVSEKGVYTSNEKGILLREFKRYYSTGGMPETIVSGNDSAILQLTNDIIQKDIMTRYMVRKPLEIRNILRFLLGSVSSETTYRALARSLGVKSEKTVGKYIDHLKETYLILEVGRYDRKLKNVNRNPRKFYCVDNGIILKNVPSFIENRGGMLENIVAVQLKRTGKEFYYYRHKSDTEVDFILPEDRVMIQVCYELNERNKEREVRGFAKAANEIKATKLLILTMEQEQSITSGGLNIEVKPVWQWILENNLEGQAS